MALELVCGAFVLFFIFQEADQIWLEQGAYAANPWNFADWLFFALAVAYAATRVEQVYGVDEDGWRGPDAHAAVEAQLDTADRHVWALAALCWVAWLRILQYLRVWRRAAILMLEIWYMVLYLVVFGAIMVVVCMAFAIAEHVMYAWSDPHYSSIVFALGMNWGSAFGEVSYWEILTREGAGSAAVKALSVLYVLMVVLLLMNLLIALLAEQTTVAHERSAKFWCFVQHGAVAHRRASVVALAARALADRLRPWRGSSTDEARCLRELAKRIKEHGKLMSEEKEDVAEAESDDEVRGEDDGKRCQ